MARRSTWRKTPPMRSMSWWKVACAWRPETASSRRWDPAKPSAPGPWWTTRRADSAPNARRRALGARFLRLRPRAGFAGGRRRRVGSAFDELDEHPGSGRRMKEGDPRAVGARARVFVDEPRAARARVIECRLCVLDEE